MQSGIGSPQSADLTQTLKEAEFADRGNSLSFGDDPLLGHYYLRKAEEVKSLIKRVEDGESVPREEALTHSTTAKRDKNRQIGTTPVKSAKSTRSRSS